MGVVTRRFLEVCRGVPGILFALVFVVAVGIGAPAGVLAIWTADPGNPAKLCSEAIEDTDGKQVQRRVIGALLRNGVLRRGCPLPLEGQATGAM